MRRPPIRIRTFILGTVLVLLLLPTLAGGAAWLIERDHQQAGIQQRLNTALAYLRSHRTEIQEPAVLQGFARLLDRLDLLAQLVIAEPGEKSQIYVSPALSPDIQRQQARKAKAGRSGTSAATKRPVRDDASGPTTTSSSRSQSRGPQAYAGRRPRLPARLPRHPGARRAPQRNHRPARRPRGRGLARRPLDGRPARQTEHRGRQGRRRRPDDRRPEQPDRRDREHRTGGRRHDSRARRDRAATSRSRRGETVPRHQRRPRPAHAAVRAARTPAGDRLPAGQPGRPPRAGRSESRRARTTDRQPVRLHPRRLHPAGAPARSRPRRRPAPRSHGRPRAHSPPPRQHVRPRRRPGRSQSSSTATASNAPSPTSSTTHSATAPRAPRSTSAGPPRTSRPSRSPSRTTDPESTPTSSPTSSNPASAEPRQPAAPTTGPGSASRSRNASSNTSTPPSPSTTNQREAQQSPSPSNEHRPPRHRLPSAAIKPEGGLTELKDDCRDLSTHRLGVWMQGDWSGGSRQFRGGRR